jgi:hypothetical protein
LSTSVKRGRTLRAWLGTSAFCGLFSAVYEHFSHGVYSNFMIFLFLVPLLGGVLPALLLRLLPRLRRPAAAARRLWNSAVAALTLGTCLTGVFEIYGAPSALVRVYWWAGGALLAAALIAWLRPRRAAHQA